jgi:penicillin-binding protein 1A
VAGKTGTTNESRDVWFVGFTPDLVAGVFVGFDKPKSLGEKETGGSLAVPIFKEFMMNANQDAPPVPFRMPPGIRQVMVDAGTGLRANFGDPGAIWESFIEGTEPGEQQNLADVIGAEGQSASNDEIGNTTYQDPTQPAANNGGYLTPDGIWSTRHPPTTEQPSPTTAPTDSPIFTPNPSGITTDFDTPIPQNETDGIY